jgi:hypothetical protein
LQVGSEDEQRSGHREADDGERGGAPAEQAVAEQPQVDQRGGAGALSQCEQACQRGDHDVAVQANDEEARRDRGQRPPAPAAGAVW